MDNTQPRCSEKKEFVEFTEFVVLSNYQTNDAPLSKWDATLDGG